MGKPQQVILVLLAIVHGLGYLIVCQVFQVQSDFGLQQPGEWVEPTNDVDDFADDDIQGMPLSGMSLFVSEYFVPAFFVQLGQVDENPVKE